MSLGLADNLADEFLDHFGRETEFLTKRDFPAAGGAKEFIVARLVVSHYRGDFRRRVVAVNGIDAALLWVEDED
jgi:hypothetical protein